MLLCRLSSKVSHLSCGIQYRHVRHFSFSQIVTPENPVISGMISSIHTVHEVTGAGNWWLPVLACTIALKTAFVLPWSIHTQKLYERRKVFMEEFQASLPHLKWKTAMAHKENGWSNKFSNDVFNFNKQDLRRRLVIKYNCHLAKIPIGFLFSMVLWLHMSFSLRNLAGSIPFSKDPSSAFEQSLAQGGTLWFDNLLISDPYFILPFIMFAANMSNIQLSSKPIGAVIAETRLQKILKNASRGAIVLMFFVSCQAPSILSFYWAISASYGLLQNSLFRTKWFQDLIKIPSKTYPVPVVSTSKSSSKTVHK